MLARPLVLLLDEATGALDPEREDAVHAAITRRRKETSGASGASGASGVEAPPPPPPPPPFPDETTVVMVAHRLETGLLGWVEWGGHVLGTGFT